MKLDTAELLEMIDTVIPELVQTRDRIDKVLVHLKMFRMEKKLSDHSKVMVILKSITSQLGVTQEELRSRNRVTRIRRARQIYCVLARNVTGLSLNEIGRKVNVNHATVLHSRKVINNARDTNDNLYDEYEKVELAVLDVLNG